MFLFSFIIINELIFFYLIFVVIALLKKHCEVCLWTVSALSPLCMSASVVAVWEHSKVCLTVWCSFAQCFSWTWWITMEGFFSCCAVWFLQVANVTRDYIDMPCPWTVYIPSQTDSSITIVSVYCQGLGNKQKRWDVCHYLRHKQFSICFLQDTFWVEVRKIYNVKMGI